MSDKPNLSDDYIKQQEYTFKLREDYRKELELKMSKDHKEKQQAFWRDTRFYWAILTFLASIKIIFD